MPLCLSLHLFNDTQDRKCNVKHESRMKPLDRNKYNVKNDEIYTFHLTKEKDVIFR